MKIHVAPATRVALGAARVRGVLTPWRSMCARSTDDDNPWSCLTSLEPVAYRNSRCRG